MKPTTVVGNISELSDLSRRLNQKSDKLNEVINSVNAKLENLNLGVEVWLLESPAKSDDPYYLDEDERFPHIDATVLGYARVENKWQLAVKEATLVESISLRGFDNGCRKVKSSRPVRPLLQATRTIRVESMALIPTLLDELKTEATRTLRGIQAAEKAAEKL